MKFFLSVFFIMAVCCGNKLFAQVNQLNSLGQQLGNSNVQYDSQGNPILKQNKKSDSLKLRDKNEDSITIHYHYFDSATVHDMDTSINDFRSRFQLPWYYTNLGNIGSQATSMLFNPYMNPGWDAGFHSMDPYAFTISNTKIYTTTRPYTTLGYMLGQKGEQYIDVLHTQPHAHGNVNFTFEYRLLNAPGVYTNQNTANNNIRANIAINSKNKRYNANFIIIHNSLRAATNGGLIGDIKSLDSLALGDLATAPVKLGINNSNVNNVFNTTVNTGNIFSGTTLFFRHSFDWGQKDSIVKDTIVYRLFYPRLRLEHTIKYQTNSYEYVDDAPSVNNYEQYYQFIVPSDTLRFQDRWKEFTNEFAIYTYPVKKNTNQYLKLFGDYQILKGNLGETSQEFDNIFVGAEYRNKTRNKKWDMDAGGKLFIGAKEYAGNYEIHVNLSRNLGKIGSLELGFQNVNQTPAYIYSATAGGTLSVNGDTSSASIKPHSDFPVEASGSFSNQNITKAYAAVYIPAIDAKITGNYFLYTNYAYFSDYFTAQQESSPFNLLQIGLNKTTRLSKYFRWYLDGYLQQKAGSADLNVPWLLLRTRIAFEGHFFNNLYLAMGFDVRYNSPYKADNYSPFVAQYFYQNSTTITNRPDVDFYLNFRITRFKLFAEYSGLNTLNLKNGFGFNHYNQVAPQYPEFGAWLRVGIWWTFIN